MLVSTIIFLSTLGGSTVKAEESQVREVETSVAETGMGLTPQELIEKMGALKQSIETMEAELNQLTQEDILNQNQIETIKTQKTELEDTLVNLKKTVEVNTERIESIKALTEKDKETYQVTKKAATEGLGNKPLVADKNLSNVKEDVDLITEKGQLQKSIIEDTDKIKALTIEAAEKEVEVQEQEVAYEEFLAGKTIVKNQLRETKIGYETSKESLVNYHGDLQTAVDELVYTGSGKFQWPSRWL